MLFMVVIAQPSCMNGFPASRLCSLNSACLCIKVVGTKENRTGGPAGEDYRSRRFRCGLPKSGQDLASARWAGYLSSIPGEARVLISSTTNAKRDRNCDPNVRPTMS